MNDGWDRIPVTNGDTEHGLEGCRVHHRDGCKGRRDSVNGAGWHVRPGTPEELARCSGRCANCERRVQQ